MGCGVLSKRFAYKQADQCSVSSYQKYITSITDQLQQVQQLQVKENNGNGGGDDEVVTTQASVMTFKTDVEKAQFYLTKADGYYKQASDLSLSGDLESFRMFRKALNDYTTVSQIDKANVNAIIGIGKCFIKLYQYHKAFEHLDRAFKKNEKELSGLLDFWLLYGVSYRKCAKIWNAITVVKRDRNGLEMAKKCFQRGLTIEPACVDVQKECEVVHRLVSKQKEYKNEFANYVKLMKQAPSGYEPCDVARKTAKETYKILSIDGGGLKSAIPNMILCEIERRCNRHLTDVFNMFIGTSAGAVINSYLTASDNIDTLKPIYSAYQPLELIAHKSNRIFPNPSNIRRLYSEKYSNKKGYDLLDTSFKNIRLSQTLNDVIIPAVNYDGPLRTVYFTNYDAKESKDKDFFIKDIVMAATAAPSYFPPYKIPGLGWFIDAAITVPNPCQKGYEEAIYRLHKKPEDLYVLSLGTGVNMNSDDTTSKQGLLHWVTNMPQYVMTGQLHDADIFMSSKVGDRYKRFDLYLENEIPIDLSTHVPDLIEIATEYVEEKSDEINKVVEILLNE